MPTGIATDDTTKFFFADCVDDRRLASLFDFENAAPIFSGVHRSYKFCLLTLTGRKRPVADAEFVFFAHRASDLADPERRFTLSPEDLALINPNTKTAPVFRSRRDAEITSKIYRNVPVLIREDDPDGNPWGIEFQRMFDMPGDSHLCSEIVELRSQGATRQGLVYSLGRATWLPLYEAKLANRFNHRFSTYSSDGSSELVSTEALRNPSFSVSARYYVPTERIREQLGDRTWLLGWRDICRATDARTLIPLVLPVAATETGSLLAHVSETQRKNAVVLPAAWASFAADFVARQKVGGTHLKYFTMRQIAVPSPSRLASPAPGSNSTLLEWVRPRVLELVFTSYDLAGFAADVGYFGEPFRWNSERRSLIQVELDAAFFHVYGLDRDDVEYVMDTFPIVRRKDEAVHGEYLTKRLILEGYDAMVEAQASGTEYRTVLDPPPADPSIAHDPSGRPDWADWYAIGHKERARDR